MAAQAFPGSWGTDPTVICRGKRAVVILILLPRCSNESLHASSDVWLWGMTRFGELYSWDPWYPTGIHDREVLYAAAGVPLLFQGGGFASPMSKSEEKLRQTSTWPNPVPKSKLILKRTGKLNSFDWYRGKNYGYNELGTTMFVSATAAGLQWQKQSLTLH